MEEDIDTEVDVDEANAIAEKLHGMKVDKPMGDMTKAEMFDELRHVRMQYELGLNQYADVQLEKDTAVEEREDAEAAARQEKKRHAETENRRLDLAKNLERVGQDRDYWKRQAAEQAGYIKALLDSQGPPLPSPMSYGRELAGDNGYNGERFR